MQDEAAWQVVTKGRRVSQLSSDRQPRAARGHVRLLRATHIGPVGDTVYDLDRLRPARHHQANNAFFGRRQKQETPWKRANSEIKA
jgi:hypothetical protein